MSTVLSHVAGPLHRWVVNGQTFVTDELAVFATSRFAEGEPQPKGTEMASACLIPDNVGARRVSLSALKAWCGRFVDDHAMRCDDGPEMRPGSLFGKPVNRNLLAKFLDAADGDEVRVVPGSDAHWPLHILGDDWTVVVMPLHPESVRMPLADSFDGVLP